MIFGMQPYYDPTRWNMEDDLNIFENGRQAMSSEPDIHNPPPTHTQKIIRTMLIYYYVPAI